jgi:RNA polymerase sigma-70 factor (ECF subfamily)
LQILRPLAGDVNKEASELRMVDVIRMASDGRTNEFMQLLTGIQSRLYAYICSMIGDATGALDVLQETNVVLWDKAGEYDQSRPFPPWAFRIAYLQVLAYRKRCLRSRLVFDESLISKMTEEFLSRDEDHATLLDALACCLEKLPGFRRELIDCRYGRGESVEQMAKRFRKTPNVISASLYRVRKCLLSCIESRLAAE